VSVNLIRESLFDFLRYRIGKCFNLQFANVLFSIKKITLFILSVCCYFKQYLLAFRSLLGRSSKLRLVNIVLDAAITRTHELNTAAFK